MVPQCGFHAREAHYLLSSLSAWAKIVEGRMAPVDDEWVIHPSRHKVNSCWQIGSLLSGQFDSDEVCLKRQAKRPVLC